MTELELCKYQYNLMKKIAIECQAGNHLLSNMMTGNRHTGKVEDCTEQSCRLFRNAIQDCDRVTETYTKSFPDLINIPSSEYQKKDNKK